MNPRTLLNSRTYDVETTSQVKAYFTNVHIWRQTYELLIFLIGPGLPVYITSLYIYNWSFEKINIGDQGTLAISMSTHIFHDPTSGIVNAKGLGGSG